MCRLQGGRDLGDDVAGPAGRQRAGGFDKCLDIGPCTKRIAMNSTPPASPASKIGMMLGWSTAAAVRDSRMNRCRKASSSASSGVRTLIATGRSSRVS